MSVNSVCTCTKMDHNFEEELREEIKKILEVDNEFANSVIGLLKDAGVDNASDLLLIEEEDLITLKPIKRRKLLSAFKTNDGGGFGKSRFDQSGGGGFLNTSVAASPSGAEKKKVGRLSNAVPCTIAQIHLMPESDENLKIGSLSANIVVLVGLVQSVDVQTTKMTYIIDDYTGPEIEVQMWIGESDELDKKIDIIPENSYARVTGAIRSMKGKRHILAFNIQRVKDFNEITMHIAEIVHTSMAVAIMDKQSPAGGGFNTSTMNPGTTASSTDTFDSSDSRKLTKPQQLVKQAITNCTNVEGMNVNDLYNSLKSVNRQSIQEALEFLCNEGHIYSTIDEDHYKSTDCV